MDPSLFPSWPARSEGAKRAKKSSPKAPEGGNFYKSLVSRILMLELDYFGFDYVCILIAVFHVDTWIFQFHHHISLFISSRRMVTVHFTCLLINLREKMLYQDLHSSFDQAWPF